MSEAASVGVTPRSDLYAVVAEFTTPEEILEAAEAVRAAGYTRTEAYTPFAVAGLDDALGMQPSRLGFIVLLAGIAGALGGFFMQWYANVVFYPLNIGGRPLNSWPNFIIITFEITVLLSALTAAGVMFFRNGLPRGYHPIFNTPGFENASRDRFFLAIEARDPKFDSIKARRLLEQFSPVAVSEVER